MSTIPWKIHWVQYTSLRLWKETFFWHLFDPTDQNKNSKTLLHIDIQNHILEYHLSIIWNVGVIQVTSLIWQKTSLINRRMAPGGKRKLRILTSHLQDMPNHILSTPENVNVVQVTNFTEKGKRRCSTLIWPLG